MWYNLKCDYLTEIAVGDVGEPKDSVAKSPVTLSGSKGKFRTSLSFDAHMIHIMFCEDICLKILMKVDQFMVLCNTDFTTSPIKIFM